MQYFADYKSSNRFLKIFFWVFLFLATAMLSSFIVSTNSNDLYGAIFLILITIINYLVMYFSTEHIKLTETGLEIISKAKTVHHSWASIHLAKEEYASPGARIPSLSIYGENECLILNVGQGHLCLPLKESIELINSKSAE